jgi:hypothetical protein
VGLVKLKQGSNLVSFEQLGPALMFLNTAILFPQRIRREEQDVFPKDTRGGWNVRLSTAIKELLCEAVLLRHDNSIHTDSHDVAELTMRFESAHPELAVPANNRTELPSDSVISQFLKEFRLSIQRTTLRKRTIDRITFLLEAALAVANLNRWNAVDINVLDEIHLNPFEGPRYSIAPANGGGAPIEGKDRDAHSYTFLVTANLGYVYHCALQTLAASTVTENCILVC